MATLLLLRASVLLGLGLLAARLMRRAPGAARHQIWSTTFAVVLLMPLLAATLPTVRVPVPARWAPTPFTAPLTTEPRPSPALSTDDLRLGMPGATGAARVERPESSSRSMDRSQIDP